MAHRTQLAVLDANPTPNGLGSDRRRRTTQADRLWTMRLPGKVVTAKMSGDGEAIALAPEEDHDDAGSEGVHTLQRDHNDGSTFAASTNSASSSSRSDAKRAALVRTRSIGIVYKPGPFLVHSSPVMRLAFRALGHNTSNGQDEIEQRSDLLLTNCEGNSGARIFCQNNWKPLTERTNPSHTRVDWVKVNTAFTLGDLETSKKSKNARSAPPSRRPSFNTHLENEANAINETLGRRQHYQSIPTSHATQSSNSGAWIAEMTFQS